MGFVRPCLGQAQQVMQQAAAAASSSPASIGQMRLRIQIRMHASVGMDARTGPADYQHSRGVTVAPITCIAGRNMQGIVCPMHTNCCAWQKGRPSADHIHARAGYGVSVIHGMVRRRTARRRMSHIILYLVTCPWQPLAPGAGSSRKHRQCPAGPWPLGS